MTDFFCSSCGLPGHRYGTTDIHHTPDKTACINGLRHRLRKLIDAISAHRDECMSDEIGEPTEYHGVAVYTHTVKLWDVLDEIEDFR